MRGAAMFFGLAALLVLSKPASAVQPISDDQMFQLIVGSWIVDPAQRDDIGFHGRELERHAMSTYKADGTGVFKIYEDVTCERVVKSVNFRWSVHDGILIWDIEDMNLHSSDQIAEIGPNRMTLMTADSINDVPKGLVQRRVRAKNCATPAS
jgi:hypothetical protein